MMTATNKHDSKATDTTSRSSSNSSNIRAQEAQSALTVARLKLRVAQERAKRKNNTSMDNDKHITSSSNATTISKKRRLLLSPLSQQHEELPQQQLQYHNTVNTTHQQQQQQQQYNRQRRRPRTPPNNSNNKTYTNTILLLPPITALSAPLLITNIAQTGPEELIYHDTYIPGDYFGQQQRRAKLEEVLLEGTSNYDITDKLHSSYSPTSSNTLDNHDYINLDDETDSSINTTTLMTETSITATTTKIKTASLAQRKLQLQKELMTLKEKLEEKTQIQKDRIKNNSNKEKSNDSNDDGDDVESCSSIGSNCSKEGNSKQKKRNKSSLAGLTKEELKRRKIEAQSIMDISYWKHFVTKQEHMLHGIQNKIINNASSLEDCLKERHTTNTQLNHIQTIITKLELRQNVIEDGIVSSTKELLHARQQLYDAKNAATIAAAATTTTSTSNSKNSTAKKKNKS